MCAMHIGVKLFKKLHILVIISLQNTLPMYINVGMNTVRCESQPNPEGQGEAVPVSDRETYPRGREGPRTYAGAAISAQDMSVGEMISDHPP